MPLAHRLSTNITVIYLVDPVRNHSRQWQLEGAVTVTDRLNFCYPGLWNCGESGCAIRVYGAAVQVEPH